MKVDLASIKQSPSFRQPIDYDRLKDLLKRYDEKNGYGQTPLLRVAEVAGVRLAFPGTLEQIKALKDLGYTRIYATIVPMTASEYARRMKENDGSTDKH